MRVHDGTAKAKLENHLIIVGFGVNGKNVARAAELAGIPFLALELNAETVQKERAAGRMVRYGDAAQPSVLQHVGVASAQALVVAIADSVAARAIVSAARAANPGLFIIVRTRLVAELPELMRLGANLVIPEEFETSVEIFAQVLKHFSIPGPEIERLVTQIREDGYRMFSELIANRNH